MGSFNGGNFGQFLPAGSNGSLSDIGPLYSWVVDLLPHLDQPTLYNDFNRHRVYFDKGRPGDDGTKPTNDVISSTDLAVLRCPDDDTVMVGEGNLSYGVNLGLTLWHADGYNGLGWCPGGTATLITLGSPQQGGNPVVFRKTAAMFQGTVARRAPWDMFQTTATITDGLANTVLISENIFGGASPADPQQGRLVPTNWAAAHPRFVGLMMSESVCPQPPSGCTPFQCFNGRLMPSGGKYDGPDWVKANIKGSYSGINDGSRDGGVEGGLPYANSKHPGGIIIGMCDGSARFLAGFVVFCRPVVFGAGM